MHIWHIRLTFHLKGTSFFKQNRKSQKQWINSCWDCFSCRRTANLVRPRRNISVTVMGSCAWSIDRQMQVTQPSQKITGSKRNAYTPKGARNLKINVSGWKSSKIDREWFKGWQCTRVGVHKEERKLLPMWDGRPLRTRPGMQGQICYLPKMTGHLTKLCRTMGEDKTKKGNVRHVTEDDDFAFTDQLGVRTYQQ